MPKPVITPLAPKFVGNSGPIPTTPECFLSIRDVLDRLTISRSPLCELIKDTVRQFPAPVHIGRPSVWVERQVEAYMRDVVETERVISPN